MLPAINRRFLLAKLGLPDRIPAERTQRWEHVQCPDRRNNPVFIANVELIPSHGNRQHRLLVQCACGKWIPFGRVHQHVPACDMAKFAVLTTE